MSAPAARGRLLLVPTPLDHGCDLDVPLSTVLPHDTLILAAGLRHWIVENAKSARAFLKRVNACVPLQAPLQALDLRELPHAVHKHGDAAASWSAQDWLAPALAGQDVGLLSEAGMPAIADPGAGVVQAAHAARLQVVPLIGPSALLLALAASGLPGQSFAFVGYLPTAADARVARIRALERQARTQGQTQLMIETPYRNPVLLGALLSTLQHDTVLSVSVGLTLPDAETRSAPVSGWRSQGGSVRADRPAVFALGGPPLARPGRLHAD